MARMMAASDCTVFENTTGRYCLLSSCVKPPSWMILRSVPDTCRTHVNSQRARLTLQCYAVCTHASSFTVIYMNAGVSRGPASVCTVYCCRQAEKANRAEFDVSRLTHACLLCALRPLSGRSSAHDDPMTRTTAFNQCNWTQWTLVLCRASQRA